MFNSQRVMQAKAIVSELLGGVPVYVVEMCDVWSSIDDKGLRLLRTGSSSAVALTGLGLDAILFETLRYQWQGRGFCAALCVNVDSLSDAELLGTLIHEAAHWADRCDNRYRDMPLSHFKQDAAWRKSARRSEARHHGLTFIGGATHLYWRARQEHNPKLRIRHVLPRLYGHSQRDVDAAYADAPALSHLSIDDVVRGYRRDLAEQRRPRRRARSYSTRQAGAGFDDVAPKGIAAIPVCGLLDSAKYSAIADAHAKALDSDDVGAIVLLINSPGGEAIGCKTVADQIFEWRGAKPTIAYVQGICASAAYYLASACDSIAATADALVGGTGTIYAHDEYSRALTKLGIGTTVFTNADSPKKGHGNRSEPLSGDARKTLQRFVNSYGRSFIDDVARYRSVERDVVKRRYGQGDTLRGSIALKRGVIDAVVSGLPEVIEECGGGDVEAITAGFERRMTASAACTSRLNTCWPLYLDRSALDSVLPLRRTSSGVAQLSAPRKTGG